MSYTKKQIAATANFIANRLFDPEQHPQKKWFCRQFKETVRGQMQTESLIFKVDNQDFGMLIDLMRQKGVAVAADFQAKLHSTGKSEFQDSRTKLTIHSGKHPERGCFYTKKLAESLMDDEQDSVLSDDDDWEAELAKPAKPLLSDFIRQQLRNGPARTVTGLEKIKQIDSKMRL